MPEYNDWTHNGNLSDIVGFEQGHDNSGSKCYMYLKNDNESTVIYLSSDLTDWNSFSSFNSLATGISGSPKHCVAGGDGLFFVSTSDNKIYAITVGAGSASCNAIELSGSHDVSALKSDGNQKLIICYKNGKIKTRSGTEPGNILTERVDLSEEYSLGTYAIDVAKGPDGWGIISRGSDNAYKFSIASSDWSSIYKENKIITPIDLLEVNYFSNSSKWFGSDGETTISTDNLDDWYQQGASLWIAVGRNGHLAYSFDGSSWTYSVIPNLDDPNNGNMGSALFYTESLDGNQSSWVMSNGWNALEVSKDEDPTDGGNWLNINIPGSNAAYDMGYSKGTRTLIICGTSSNVLRSTNLGSTWSTISTPASNGGQVSQAIISNGQSEWLFAKGEKIYKSTDDGSTWALSATLAVAPHNIIWSGTHYVSLSSGTIYRSTDGETWISASTGAGSVSHAASDGSIIIAAGAWGSLYKSTDHGDTWSQLNSAIGLSMHTVATDGSKWVVGANDGKIQLSTDSGETWQEVADELFGPGVNEIKCIACNIT